MSVTILSSAMAQMADRGRISANDVLSLRQTVFADGIASADEADILIRLHNVCAPDIESWTRFFIDALTDYIVYQTLPRGYVTAENADWLIGRISTGGKVENTTDMELLISVLDKARWAPPRLAAFALEQVRRAVVDGEGPLASGSDFRQGVISKAEIDTLRRILYAYGGEQKLGISRAEAEVLFELNETTAGKPNHRDWPELFMKAMANHLMVVSGYKPPMREQVLRRESWFDSHENIAAFIDKMTAGTVASLCDAYKLANDDERAFARLEKDRLEMLLGEALCEDEAAWLAGRMDRGEELTGNEKALLALLQNASPDIHPAFAPLLQRAS